MHTETAPDVPSPIDLRTMEDARDWERTAMTKRPWRATFFERFASEIRNMPIPVHRVLELGSGPGFLAQHLLLALPGVEMTLLDFSSAMHRLAEQRLGQMASRVRFIERSFKDSDWATELGRFDCVVTNQAVHELRHKRYASALHVTVRDVLIPNGIYLVCDHFAGEDGMKNDQLYMSVDEQKQALISAGFKQVDLLLRTGGLVLHRAV